MLNFITLPPGERHDDGDAAFGERFAADFDVSGLRVRDDATVFEFVPDACQDQFMRCRRGQRFELLQLATQVFVELRVAGNNLAELVQRRAACHEGDEAARGIGIRIDAEHELFGDDGGHALGGKPGKEKSQPIADQCSPVRQRRGDQRIESQRREQFCVEWRGGRRG